MRLNQKVVDALSLPEGKTDIVFWAAEPKGLGVRLWGKSGKVYMIQYRIGNQGKRYKIGDAALLKYADALAQAKELLRAVEKGQDPAADKQAKRRAVMVSELADDYLEHVKAHRKDSTHTHYSIVFRVHIKPALGKMKVEQVGKRHVMALHAALGKPKPSKTGETVKTGKYMANRVLAVLSAFYTYAASVGACPDGYNPCHGVEKFKEHSRERLLSPEELAALVDAFDKMEEAKAWPWGVHAMRLLLYTGCRRGEILTLRWQDVDLEAKRLNLPDSKTGKKVVHLNAAAVAVLKRLEDMTDGEYVIAGRRPGGHTVDMKGMWHRTITIANLPGLRIHDMRHAFASVGVASGLGLPIVAKALGHRNVSTTQKYAHLAADPVAAAVDFIGDKMLEMIEGGRKIRKVREEAEEAKAS